MLRIACGGPVFVLFCHALLSVLSSFATVLGRRRELVALLLLYYGCLGAVNVLCLFLTVPWVCLQCVIVVFPDHTHLLFYAQTVCFENLLSSLLSLEYNTEFLKLVEILVVLFVTL